MGTPIETLAEAAKSLRAAHGNCDILVYQGRVNREGYERVSMLCERQTGRENVVAIISTMGGDPNAAFPSVITQNRPYKITSKPAI